MGEEMFLFKIPKDEWITIADTTLTEDVVSLEFTTDINGNPFKCKEIVIELPLGGSGVTGQNWYFGVNGECRAQTINTWGMYLVMKVNEFFAQYWGMSWATWLQDAQYRSTIRTKDNIKVIDRFVCYTDGSAPIPAGQRIRVWGLKA